MHHEIDITDSAMETFRTSDIREYDYSSGDILDLSILKPDDIIKIGNSSNLNLFESEYVKTLLPKNDFDELDRWGNRARLSEEIRPKGFNGRILDIRAIILENPYEQLVESLALHKRKNDSGVENTIGFRLLADLVSSGIGCIGSLDTRVWVWNRLDTPNARAFGVYGRRIEKIDTKSTNVDKSIEAAKLRGEIALKRALQRPISTGFGTSSRK